MTATLRVLALATLLCALAQSAHAELTRVELTDPAKPPVLRVEIEWGSIRVTGDAAADTISVDAVPDHRDELTGALISVSEEGNRVVITQAPLPSGAFRSANLEIRTPPRVTLDLVMNRGGDIHVERLAGSVEVTNLNGSVALREISGGAVVNASNGSIDARFSAVDAQRELLFTSLNGSVTLCLPADFSSRLHLSTAGDAIRSDFPVERDEAARTVGAGDSYTGQQSEVRGRIGDGEGLLRVSTLNGDIQLRRCG